MARVKRGKSHVKRRKNILKQAKGYKWGRKKKIGLAQTAITKAGVYSFRDRRTKKRAKRALWQTQLNAALREHGLTYSKFIGDLKKKNIELDRKVLAEIAENNPKIFEEITKAVR